MLYVQSFIMIKTREQRSFPLFPLLFPFFPLLAVLYPPFLAEWLSSWLAEQEDRGSIPGLATWIFRDWLSPASKLRYGWKIAKSTLILKTTNNQPTNLWLKPFFSIHPKTLQKWWKVCNERGKICNVADLPGEGLQCCWSSGGGWGGRSARGKVCNTTPVSLQKVTQQKVTNLLRLPSEGRSFRWSRDP